MCPLAPPLKFLVVFGQNLAVLDIVGGTIFYKNLNVRIVTIRSESFFVGHQSQKVTAACSMGSTRLQHSKTKVFIF
jgi:hypothetical protein